MLEDASTALLIAMLWLTGCVTPSFDARASYPHLIDFSPFEQARDAEEVNALSEGAIVIPMLSDWSGFARSRVRMPMWAYRSTL